MPTLTPRPSATQDPRAPRQKPSRQQPVKKSKAPALVSSAAAIFLIMFSMGAFPQINHFFSSANSAMHSHNDQIVAEFIHLLPLGVFLFGLLALLYLLVHTFGRRGKAA